MLDGFDPPTLPWDFLLTASLETMVFGLITSIVALLLDLTGTLGGDTLYWGLPRDSFSRCLRILERSMLILTGLASFFD